MKQQLASLLIAILLPVPFTSQAPTGQWGDPTFQNGCEEAALVMAMHWVNKTPIASPAQAVREIRAITAFEASHYHGEPDRSAADTVQLMKDYYHYPHVVVQNDVGVNDIKQALQHGKLVIAPMDGQKLHNPFYTPPGPLTHMLVITGYDSRTDEFITNDSGTRRGSGYRYGASVLFAAIRDYPTGSHVPTTRVRKNIIIVSSS